MGDGMKLNSSVYSGLWQIKNLTREDFEDVCSLCRSSFPLDYPIYWFQEVVEGKYISFGLFFHSEPECSKPELTSLLVAEKKRIRDCEPEDRNLHKDPDATVIYILSLAVQRKYQRMGIATLLLNYLKSTYFDPPLPQLIFLHVLCENEVAINFYKKNGFKHHATLKDYYQIDNMFRSGYTFVLYTRFSIINSVLHSIKDLCKDLIANLLYRRLLHPLLYPIRMYCLNLSAHPRRIISI